FDIAFVQKQRAGHASSHPATGFGFWPGRRHFPPAPHAKREIYGRGRKFFLRMIFPPPAINIFDKPFRSKPPLVNGACAVFRDGFFRHIQLLTFASASRVPLQKPGVLEQAILRNAIIPPEKGNRWPKACEKNHKLSCPYPALPLTCFLRRHWVSDLCKQRAR
ncbi:MAG TPA: hypothetical protein VMO20_03955, partial [Candidatus Acidoferrum sp.]|nr:hypothetical protein [Candidatus Acidoferrum sp.]